MENKNLTINISTGTVLKIFGILLILTFAYFIRDIILIVFISVIFAAIIEPMVNFMEAWSLKVFRRKIPRALVVLFIYLILFLFLSLVVRLIIPPIVEQVALLTSNFPELWNKILENFSSLKQYSRQRGLIDSIQQSLQGVESGLRSAARGVYSFFIAVFRGIINFFLAVAPAQYRDYLVNLFGQIQKKIGAWARGQLILGLIIGVLSFIGLIILLPKYALSLALVSGVTEMVPYLGPILGAIPAVFLGFAVQPFSLWRGVSILILYIVIQQVEEKFIVPQVMKKQLGLDRKSVV